MNYSKKKSTALNIIKKRKIKILLKEPRNNECFECQELNPDFISLNNGIFICKKCVINHLDFPNTVSNIIKNDLNNLTLKSIQYLCFGGNRKLSQFIDKEYPNLRYLSPIYFYQTYAMNYYRKCLEYLIEGGVRPFKPDYDKAYELITQKNTENDLQNLNNENINNFYENNLKIKNQNLGKTKSETYIEKKSKDINNKIFPRIKPIVGRSEFRYTRSFSRQYKNSDLIPNFTISSFKKLNYSRNFEENFNNGKLNSSTSSDIKNRYNSLFKNNYDSDMKFDDKNEYDLIDINEQINNMSEIGELPDLNENDNSKLSNNDNIKIRNRINKRNKRDINDNMFKVNFTCSKNTINNNKDIYTKPIYQNYLSTFQDLNNSNKKFSRNDNSFKFKNFNSNTTGKKQGKNFINSIEELRVFLNKNKNYKKGFKVLYKNYNSKKRISLEEISPLKTKEKKRKSDYDNINNNIIINRNLNFFYNNNHNIQNIFRKKTIGNSFSISEKSQNKNKSKKSLDKYPYLKTTTDEDDENNILNSENKFKTDNKKKLNNIMVEKNNQNTFIKVNKINPQKKIIKETNNLNNKSTGNIILDNNKNIDNLSNNINEGYNNEINLNNNINDNKEEEQKSELIQRLSRVLKMQRERNEKIKSSEKIRVNQKTINTNGNSRNPNLYKKNYIGVNTIEKKGKEKQNEKYINRSYTESKFQTDSIKANHILIKEIINLPYGKRRKILDIIKTNNLSSNSPSQNQNSRNFLRKVNSNKNF